MRVADEIKKLHLDGEVSETKEDLTKYSHDASIFEVKPRVVVYPKNVEDVEKVVSFVSSAKDFDASLSITPRSAGTDMSGGALGESIILSFTEHLNKILEISSDYAVTEPGVFYRDFEKETLKNGKMMPSYPASREIAAMGGLVANNSGGEKTLTYGKVENYVEEVSMVLSDGKEHTFKALNEQQLKEKLEEKSLEGEIYQKVYKLIENNWDLLQEAKPRVSKNSAGYYLWNVYNKDTGVFDITKLLVGSQGTLGIVTKAKFRLVSAKQHSKMVVIFLKDLKNLAQIVEIVLPYKPETFESYDDNTLHLAVRYMPELIKILKPKNVFKIGLQFLPEVWMAITGGVPRLVLMAEFTADNPKEIDERMEHLQKELKKFGATSRVLKDEEEAQKYWVIRRESFNLLRKHLRGKRTAPFIDDLVVKPQYLPEFLPQLNKILSEYNLTYTIAGHVGDGNFHIIPLMDFKDPATHEIIPKLSKQVYNLVLQYHGSITGEHNDGLVRSPFLKQMYGEKVYSLFEQVKKIFDPQNIFNPGKKVGSSLEYSMSHLVKDS